MNIQLLCRINGAFVILNGLSALVFPSMWFSMAGFTAVGPAAFAICQALGVAAIGLGIISWIIVFVPFMLMSFITTILLIVFGLDPDSTTQ